jgi:hypothetical protein
MTFFGFVLCRTRRLTDFRQAIFGMRCEDPWSSIKRWKEFYQKRVSVSLLGKLEEKKEILVQTLYVNKCALIPLVQFGEAFWQANHINSYF